MAETEEGGEESSQDNEHLAAMVAASACRLGEHFEGYLILAKAGDTLMVKHSSAEFAEWATRTIQQKIQHKLIAEQVVRAIQEAGAEEGS